MDLLYVFWKQKFVSNKNLYLTKQEWSTDRQIFEKLNYLGSKQFHDIEFE